MAFPWNGYWVNVTGERSPSPWLERYVAMKEGWSGTNLTGGGIVMETLLNRDLLDQLYSNFVEASIPFFSYHKNYNITDININYLHRLSKLVWFLGLFFMILEPNRLYHSSWYFIVYTFFTDFWHWRTLPLFFFNKVLPIMIVLYAAIFKL